MKERGFPKRISAELLLATLLISCPGFFLADFGLVNRRNHFKH